VVSKAVGVASNDMRQLKSFNRQIHELMLKGLIYLEK
jgi:hypothetical protein